MSWGHSRQAEEFTPTSSSILAPVYGPLAKQIVAEFQLADKQGIGIDLGSGHGDLIIELCRRTKKLHWINADINPRHFPHFMAMADCEGFEERVSAIYADAVALPFRDDFAEILVSRGSFHFWKNLQKAFLEIFRVLKPGGVAFVGRGFSDNLPGAVAEKIRSQQRERGFKLTYDVAATAAQLESIMQLLGIKDYQVRIPISETHRDTRYGIWIEFHKPL
jgi:ubiquinone/menaquinone biosynthesis C-methylase UbiE